jgi:hypothetical protein
MAAAARCCGWARICGPTFGVVAALGFASALLAAAAAGFTLRWPLAGAATAVSALVLIALVVWRTAQTTAIVRRAVDRVALAQNMAPISSGPEGAPLISPSRLRTYSLRTALIFVVMIVGVARASTARSGHFVAGHRAWKRDERSVDFGVPNTPGGSAPNGDIYFCRFQQPYRRVSCGPLSQ